MNKARKIWLSLYNEMWGDPNLYKMVKAEYNRLNWLGRMTIGPVAVVCLSVMLAIATVAIFVMALMFVKKDQICAH